jgi:hypothetical protein
MPNMERQMMTPKHLFPVAALGLAMGLGINTNAHAFAYAFADVRVFDASITFLPIDQTDLDQFGTCLTNSCASSGTPDTTSVAGAALGGTGDFNNSNVDAPIAFGDGSVFPDGTAPIENDFTAEGGSNGHKYAWADSQIVSQQTLGSPPVNLDGTPNNASLLESRTAAEANSNDGTLASGTSKASSDTEVTVTIGQGGARVRFDFSVELLQAAQITAPHDDTLAESIAQVAVTIKDEDENNVFRWELGSSPTGTIGAATFGNDFVFPGEISTTSQDVLDGGTPLSGDFFSVTGNLSEGIYDLTLSADVEVSAQAAPIPEPTSLALMGLGLLGLGGVSARRKMMGRAGC